MPKDLEWDEPPATTDELRERLTALGFGERADELIAELVRPGVALAEGEVGREDPQGTRLGGRPWLADDIEWPMYEDYPLSHIAQINLADVAELLPEVAMPSSGVLSFFYPSDEIAFGYAEEAEAGAWRVVLTPADAAASLRDYPAALGEDVWERPRAVALEPTRVLTFAPWESEEVWALDRDVAEAWAAAAPSPHEQNRFGGHPSPNQGSVAGGVAYERLGEDASEAEQNAEARRWRLLAQFDSISEAGFAWGDGGILYWMIRPEDLAAGNLDEVWLQLQTC